MFQFIYNIYQSIGFSLYMIILTIITGKLPKISFYHFDYQSHNNSPFNICSDKFIKTDVTQLITDKCKQRIIENFIEHLTDDDNFMNPVNQIDFPIFDAKEIMGSQGVYSVIQKSLKEYINNLK